MVQGFTQEFTTGKQLREGEEGWEGEGEGEGEEIGKYEGGGFTEGSTRGFNSGNQLPSPGGSERGSAASAAVAASGGSEGSATLGRGDRAPPPQLTRLPPSYRNQPVV